MVRPSELFGRTLGREGGEQNPPGRSIRVVYYDYDHKGQATRREERMVIGKKPFSSRNRASS